jgi:hypothetical protein
MSDQRPLSPAPPAVGPSAPPGASAPTKAARTRWLAPVVLAVALALIFAAIVYTSAVHEDRPKTAPSDGMGSAGEVPVLSAPHGLKATAGPFVVKVTWKPAADATAQTRYEVDRGAHLEGLTDKTSFTDLHVMPATTYDYTVVALTKDGGRSVDSAVVKVKTPSAPASSARLEAIFNFDVVATSHYGFSTFNSERSSFGWRFDPVCGNGACNTTLTDVHTHDFTFLLTRSRGTYHGVTTTKGFGSCNGITTTATVTVDLRVEKAQAVKSDWRVSRVAGTMTTRTAAQLGCVSSGIDYRLTGTLAGLR